MLKLASTDIQIAMYKISRCIDTGNFHKELKIGQTEDLKLTEKIPCCCKVKLFGELSPLIISFSKLKPGFDLHVFTSFLNPEPSENDHDESFLN